MMEINIEKFQSAIKDCESIKLNGKVTQVIGLVIESRGPNVSLGELCYICSNFPGVEPIPADVVGFRDGFMASSGILHVFPIRNAPAIRPF